MSVTERAASLVDELASKCVSGRCIGSMSVSIYDTAWVSMIRKPKATKELEWLFPQSFTVLLDSQLSTGSWEGYASDTDAIINTLAALLALCVHRQHADENDSDKNLSDRIQQATVWLEQALPRWNVVVVDQVGFELIIPALTRRLEGFGISLFMPPLVLEKNKQKMKLFNPKLLLGPQTTLLHSLEALPDTFDYDAIGHQKRNGSFLGSPSATASYLMNVSEWDEEAEAYLKLVYREGAGDSSGYFPSAFPSQNFELSWVLTTLLDGGLTVDDLGSQNVSIIADVLEGGLRQGDGCIGFASGFMPDADDTSKTLSLLSSCQRTTDAAPLTKTFRNAGSCYKTYQLERNPSFSANCNVLIAMIALNQDGKHENEIVEIAQALCDMWTTSPPKDKWNLSEQYSMMLLAKAFSSLSTLMKTEACNIPQTSHLGLHLHVILVQILRLTLKGQGSSGSWGRESCEITAYAVLTLTSLVSLEIASTLMDDVVSAIKEGRQFLIDSEDLWDKPHPIWVEKVAYSSPVLALAYCIAAVSSSSQILNNSKYTESRQGSMSAQVLKMTTFLSKLPTFGSRSALDLKLSVVESSIYRMGLEQVRLDTFPRNDMQKDKYLEFIPVTWVACNDLSAHPLDRQTIWTMIHLSMLNYQIDEYMETSVHESYIQEPGVVRKTIQTASKVDSAAVNGDTTRSNGSHSSNGEDGSNGKDISNGKDRTNGTDNSNGTGNPNGTGSSNGKHHTQNQLHLPNNQEIHQIASVVSKYASFVLKHECVSHQTQRTQTQLQLAFTTFLEAHLTQISDNQSFAEQSVRDEFNTERTYYDWVHTTSAEHTSCPFSYLFYCCLISKPSKALFPTPKGKYLAEAMVRQLATLCRQYNDIGSVARDKAEVNLNSVNFQEFSRTSDGAEPEARDAEAAKKDLMAIAEYERVGLERTLAELEGEMDEANFARLKLFVTVTNLYGEIYMARDIASRMK